MDIKSSIEKIRECYTDVKVQAIAISRMRDILTILKSPITEFTPALTEQYIKELEGEYIKLDNSWIIERWIEPHGQVTIEEGIELTRLAKITEFNDEIQVQIKQVYLDNLESLFKDDKVKVKAAIDTVEKLKLKLKEVK